MNTSQEIISIVERVEVESFAFTASTTPNGVYFQVSSIGRNVKTGEIEVQKGGKRYLSGHATEGEIVQQLLSAVLSFQEHETRENFLYDGLRIFSPHLSIEALKSRANDEETRA